MAAAAAAGGGGAAASAMIRETATLLTQIVHAAQSLTQPAAAAAAAGGKGLPGAAAAAAAAAFAKQPSNVPVGPSGRSAAGGRGPNAHRSRLSLVSILGRRPADVPLVANHTNGLAVLNGVSGMHRALVWLLVLGGCGSRASVWSQAGWVRV